MRSLLLCCSVVCWIKVELEFVRVPVERFGLRAVRWCWSHPNHSSLEILYSLYLRYVAALRCQTDKSIVASNVRGGPRGGVWGLNILCSSLL